MSEGQYQEQYSNDDIGRPAGPLDSLKKMKALREEVLHARHSWSLLRPKGNAGNAVHHLGKAANAMLRDIEYISNVLKRKGL
jgi:hypothetical protein